MNVDEILQSDGQRWRAAVTAPPDLTRAARQAVTHPHRRRRGTLVASAALVVAALVGLLLYVRVGSDHTAITAVDEVPNAIREHGRTIPLAGTIPWDSAIADPYDTRRLSVLADGDRIHGNVCGLPEERAYAHRADGRIVIVVAGYARPLGDDTSCADVGHAPQRVIVHLPADVGPGGLLDPTTGKHHTVLDLNAVPRITAPLPMLCRPSSTTWDDVAHRTTRFYFGSERSRGFCSVTFTYGRPKVARSDARGTVQGAASIHGRKARVSLYEDSNNHEWTIEWQPNQSHGIELEINSDPRHPLAGSRVIAIARSIT